MSLTAIIGRQRHDDKKNNLEIRKNWKPLDLGERTGPTAESTTYPLSTKDAVVHIIGNNRKLQSGRSEYHCVRGNNGNSRSSCDRSTCIVHIQSATPSKPKAIRKHSFDQLFHHHQSNAIPFHRAFAILSQKPFFSPPYRKYSRIRHQRNSPPSKPGVSSSPLSTLSSIFKTSNVVYIITFSSQSQPNADTQSSPLQTGLSNPIPRLQALKPASTVSFTKARSPLSHTRSC